MCTAPLKNMTGFWKTGFFGLSNSDQNFRLTATGHLLKAQGKLIFLKEIILVNAFESKILYNTKQTKCHTQYPSWWKGWDQLCGVSLSIRRDAWKQREKKNLPSNAAVIHKNWSTRKVVESTFWQVFLGKRIETQLFKTMSPFQKQWFR